MNYSNLNDYEFEYLCKDVMSRKLSQNLERFAKGRDGGVDLTNDSSNKSIIVQVRHYDKTSASGLINSLKKEVPKVKEHNPKQYYVCCSKELTSDNKTSIYDLFSEYMDSTSNIITALELDEFLEKNENIDILRKHFKLWIDSANLLVDMQSNDIFIDSDTLLYDAQNSIKYFVQTSAYDKALKYLENNNALILVGNPGVGKTITSKMLILYYALQGYRVRYTTDISSLNELKKSLSQSPETKEIVLLDDCFGQAYFNMKESQSGELVSLIDYVCRHSSKKIILNSRITIYNEARNTNQYIDSCFDGETFRILLIDVNDTLPLEKGKILYNHLFFNNIPDEYFKIIKEDRNYLKIVNHSNYNPRIIEFVCNKNNYLRVRPDAYPEFIYGCLEKPNEVWRNEYERRLEKPDRMLLTTLFSLSDADIHMDMLRICYQYRISKDGSLDPTIDYYAQSMNRLTDGMIKVKEDRDGEIYVSAASPSVNDYLRERLNNNVPEAEDLLQSLISVRQICRLLEPEFAIEIVAAAFKDKSILQYVFENENQKSNYIAAFCADNSILDLEYKPYIFSYIENPSLVYMYGEKHLGISNILNKIFSPKFSCFYGVDSYIKDPIKLRELLEGLWYEDIVDVVNGFDWIFKGVERNWYRDLVRIEVCDVLDDYCSSIDAGDYDGYVDEALDIVNENADNYNEMIQEAESIVESWVEEEVREEILNLLEKLPEDIDPDNSIYNTLSISVFGAESVVKASLVDYDEDIFRESQMNVSYQISELDYLFS